MARTLVNSDYRLEVYPRNVNTIFNRDMGPREIADIEYRIIRELRDELLGLSPGDMGGVFLESTPITYCGTEPWRVDDEGDNRGRWPHCCDADQREFYVDHRIESDAWFKEAGMDDEGMLRELRKDATLNQ